MKAWTDYPFLSLGDTPGQKAPIREIEVYAYDGDKYVMISVDGRHAEIKACYCYAAPGRLGEVPTIDVAGLHEEVGP